MSAPNIVPVILSGGTGSRLWPLSRESHPKQFWPLLSPMTMVQETARRAMGPGFAPPVVVVGEGHRFLVAEQLREAGIAEPQIILEPEGRNSAPAIAVAALLIAEAQPDAVLWIMAADAAISDVPALHAALELAAQAARGGRIVTFGMRPTEPQTGFGYIELGEPIADMPGVRLVQSFTEKPDLATAERLSTDGGHVWNSGMFVATASTLIAELREHAPAVLTAARAALEGAARDLDFIRLGAEAFREAPAISIDYAVMERTRHAAVVPADLGWSDVGSWDALWQTAPKDAAGNVVQGPVEMLDSTGSYVRSEGILTAVLGLQDVVVVVTDDAVLAMPRSRAQDVKRVVERLKARGAKQAVEHRRMYRPWGHYEGLIMGDRFQVKQIVVMPGGRLSLQKHHHRAEHWVVVKGTARVQRDAESLLLSENQSVYLPLGCIHRLENPGMIPLALIEVQVGSYLGEDDIVRLEDTYGRS
ncbi:mannose-1-phosphate guanylyltransferase/mannose-6-phosphate isomerase [Sediminicoccus sp. KRV36]|uniref:mannose-1-phosphate guanylyltransferase/mannose-6-phosphate isomerase n=1 Tax=Sediminicoccus sp. KRV36 TaxID=3133721 RepID=UPI00200DBFD9|nr:mannose-1-phosphate guanylyltransferase/mannose-6-phosphate isomerase [Sediminicoccus rosea]UPY38149.1 mannose-1-phosphate guanylyltransferase/mannose-6-phosphate isomerase [Sediminicoccus rosea]